MQVLEMAIATIVNRKLQEAIREDLLLICSDRMTKLKGAVDKSIQVRISRPYRHMPTSIIIPMW